MTTRDPRGIRSTRMPAILQALLLPVFVLELVIVLVVSVLVLELVLLLVLVLE